MQYQCKICSKIFQSTKNRIYCSNKCKFSDSKYNESRKRKTKEYKALECKLCQKIFSNNLGAPCTLHLKEKHNVNIQSFKKKYSQILIYFKEVKLIKKEKLQGLICKICNKDVGNKNNTSGVLTKHLKREHKISLIDYVTTFIEEKYIVENQKRIDLRHELCFRNGIENIDYIVCKLCNKKMKKITNIHLKLHNLTPTQYKIQYGNTMSEVSHKKHSESTIRTNKNNNTSFPGYSKEELRIFLNFPSFQRIPKLCLIDSIYGNKWYDFYKDKTIIEWDNLHWHPISLEKLKLYQLENINNDFIKNQLVINNGYSIYRLNDETSTEQNYKEKSYSYYDKELNENKLFIPKWNTEILIERDYILTLTKNQKEKLSKEIFKFIRNFTIFEDYLPIYDFSQIEKISSGYDLMKSEFHNIFDVINKYARIQKSTRNIFYDDTLLLPVIQYRCGLNNSKLYTYKIKDQIIQSQETFNITKNEILKGINSYYRSTPSLFKINDALSIYSKYCKEGETTLDLSAGFGGRLIGAMKAKLNYIGIEPNTKTFQNLEILSKKLNYKSKLYQHCSEDYIPELKNSIDFIFTSIPFFDTEKYSNDITQSYVKYSTIEQWIENYLKKTIENASRYIKNDKYIAINVNNELKQNLLNFSNLKYSHSEFINLTTSHFNKKTNQKQTEILFFQKC